MMNQARHESSGVKLEVNERWVPLPAPEPQHRERGLGTRLHMSPALLWLSLACHKATLQS